MSHERITVTIGTEPVEVCAECTTWGRIVEWESGHGETN